MSAVFVGVGLAATSAYMSYDAGKTGAYNQEQAANYNSAAALANGRIQAEMTEFDAVGTQYQAKMEGVSNRLNAEIFKANAKMVRFAGDAKTTELLAQARYAMQDAAVDSEGFAKQAFAIAKERRASGAQFSQDLADIEVDAVRKKAMAKAAFAAMGVGVDAGSMEVVDQEIDRDAERDAGRVMLARTIESLSLAKQQGEASSTSRHSLERGKHIAEALNLSAKVTGLETDQAQSAAEIQAEALAQSGTYMDWYAGFVKERATIQATAERTGANIRSENALIVGASNASASRAQGTAGAISSLGSAFNIWANRPQQT